MYAILGLIPNLRSTQKAIATIVNPCWVMRVYLISHNDMRTYLKSDWNKLLIGGFLIGAQLFSAKNTCPQRCRYHISYNYIVDQNTQLLTKSRMMFSLMSSNRMICSSMSCNCSRLMSCIDRSISLIWNSCSKDSWNDDVFIPDLLVVWKSLGRLKRVLSQIPHKVTVFATFRSYER
jgi:hypothetical protein